jgi:cell division GTPase FtsZ
MVLDRVQQHAQTKNDKGEVVLTDIIWGMSIKPELKDDELEAIIVATGFNDEEIVSLPPIDSSEKKEKSHITSLLEQKVESRVERGVPTPIGRTNDDYTEILLAKRTYIMFSRSEYHFLRVSE